MEKVSRAMLECPVCGQIPQGAIYMCKAGDSICTSCCSGGAVKRCPKCNGPFGKGKHRNLALEGVVGSMEVPCKFEEEGCRDTVMRKEMGAHASSCKFRPFQFCSKAGFVPNCRYGSGSPASIFDHIEAEHKFSVTKMSESHAVETSKLLDSLKRSVAFGASSLYQLARKGDLEETKLFLYIFIDLVKAELKTVCLHFGETKSNDGDGHDECPFSVTLELGVPTKRVKWSWTGIPSYYKNAEEISSDPPFKVSTKRLLDAVGADDCLEYTVAFNEN